MNAYLRLFFHVCLLFFPAWVWAQPHTDQPLQSGNAAMKYWQAFTLLPTLNAHQEKLLEDWKTISLNEETSKMLKASQMSLQYLLRGAACTHCYWDLNYEDGPGLVLPHLAKARTLARLASLQIRADFEQGKNSSAVDYLLALFSLARRVGNDPILITILVGYSIEYHAMDAVAPFLAGLDRTELARLSSRYAALGTISLIREGIMTEKRYMNGWLVQRLESAEKLKAGDWRDAWLKVLMPVEGKTEPYHEKIKQVTSYDDARRLTRELAPVYDELAYVFSLPHAEHAGRFEKLIQEARKSNPLAEALLPAVTKTAAAQDRYQTRQALFRAALLIVEKGPDEFKTIPDPFGDGPFEYRKLNQGFELLSKLHYAGQPTSYKVGK